jgi:hypothetical protein
LEDSFAYKIIYFKDERNHGEIAGPRRRIGQKTPKSGRSSSKVTFRT